MYAHPANPHITYNHAPSIYITTVASAQLWRSCSSSTHGTSFVGRCSTAIEHVWCLVACMSRPPSFVVSRYLQARHFCTAFAEQQQSRDELPPCDSAHLLRALGLPHNPTPVTRPCIYQCRHTGLAEQQQSRDELRCAITHVSCVVRLSDQYTIPIFLSCCICRRVGCARP
jgi:hypothetical protein